MGFMTHVQARLRFDQLLQDDVNQIAVAAGAGQERSLKSDGSDSLEDRLLLRDM